MKMKGGAIFLDDVDWKILRLLQKDAKQTYTEIGRRLDIAHSTVYDRIRKMEKYGVIKKYAATVDIEKVGLKYITALVTIFTDPRESENIAEKLSESKEVLEVFTSLSEELSVIAKMVADDQTQLHSFIAKSVAPLPGVSKIRTSIITKKYKEEAFSINLYRNKIRSE